MKTSIIPANISLGENSKDSFPDQLARRLVKTKLENICTGEIVIRENNSENYFGNGHSTPMRVYIDIHHSSFWSDMAFGGVTGAGEAYIKGSWSCSDLVTLVRIMLQNREVIEQFDGRFGKIKVPARKILHWLSRNTRQGSRRNIQAHYDLGNDFFKLFLDPTMMYSSAYFTHRDMSLDQAATAKLDLICRKLDLQKNDSVLEIGTGWGGFAIHAASHYGCHVTTTTISDEQHALATDRVKALGLDNKITLLKQDYRDLQGQYDKLVSIEMIEAIGHQYMDCYFKKCHDLLKTDGSMLIQAITITDHRYKKALTTIDFIKKYIFPGGFLPSVTAMTNSIAKSGDMKIIHLEDIGHHYAKTLAHWRTRFHHKKPEILCLGYSQSFLRLWDFYLCYCEGGFHERELGTVHLIASKPASRLTPLQCKTQ